MNEKVLAGLEATPMEKIRDKFIGALYYGEKDCTRLGIIQIRGKTRRNLFARYALLADENTGKTLVNMNLSTINREQIDPHNEYPNLSVAQLITVSAIKLGGNFSSSQVGTELLAANQQENPLSLKVFRFSPPLIP
jgi:hypothetical protein